MYCFLQLTRNQAKECGCKLVGSLGKIEAEEDQRFLGYNKLSIKRCDMHNDKGIHSMFSGISQ